VVSFINDKLWIPRPIGAALVLVSLFLVIVFSGNYLVEPAGMWFERLPRELKQTEIKLSLLKKSIKNVHETTDKIGEIAKVGTPFPEPKTVVVQGPNLFNRVLNSTQSFLIGLTSYLVLLYFLVIFSTTLAKDTDKLLKNKRQSITLIRIARKSQARISRYLAVITIENIILGVVVTLTTWATGLPNPIVWGGSAALLNYIPYVGPAINIAIIFMVSLLTFDSMSHILLPPLLILAINLIEGQVVQPMTVGQIFTINPVVIFLSVLVWGWLWGVAGVFMAVPILMVISITIQESNNFQLNAEQSNRMEQGE
jgi:predicted PurR-regulated permease PerM